MILRSLPHSRLDLPSITIHQKCIFNAPNEERLVLWGFINLFDLGKALWYPEAKAPQFPVSIPENSLSISTYTHKFIQRVCNLIQLVELSLVSMASSMPLLSWLYVRGSTAAGGGLSVVGACWKCTPTFLPMHYLRSISNIKLNLSNVMTHVGSQR